MRKKLNLDLKSLDRLMILVHGQYGHGKTDLAGDMLRYEKQFGEVRFLNVKGEDGYMTLANFGLGESGEEIENFADADAILKELEAKPVHALAVDSLKPLAQKVVYGKICGEGVLPKESGQWTAIHFAMEALCVRLRRCAKYVICTCPSDKSVNQLDGNTYITPDLPGREAVGAAGWFDMVGFIKAETLAGKVKRTLKVGPSPTIVTRQRLPKIIVEDLELPTGPGGWLKLKQRVEESLK